MPKYHPSLLVVGLALLLGCGSGPRVAAQPTATPLVNPVAATASPPAASPPAASPPAASSPAAASPAAVSPSPLASPPGLAAVTRAQLATAAPSVNLELVSNRFEQPLYATHAGDGSGRLFVVERKGRIVFLRPGETEPSLFLDISPLVGSRGTEQGLLSVAFHPDHAANGLFYVNYTDLNGDTVVARYQTVSGDPDRADPHSGATLLSVEQPAQNHNGGLVKFGPDGYLYIGMGDGGRAGDPWGNAQNRGVLLGKLLRIDVNNGQPYAIPPDNPFVGDPSARPEVWAYGLRNPWRFSWDRSTGDLLIADVGQGSWEWVHLQPAGAAGGQNYGWNVLEGSHCYPPGRSCDPSAYVLPILEYSHAFGCSITGGYVYRGQAYPELGGLYFYGDFCSGRLWAAEQQPDGTWLSRELAQTPHRISSFGEDEAGELYLTSFADNGLYRLTTP